MHKNITQAMESGGYLKYNPGLISADIILTEGPTSWEALDTRGNLGTEHNDDWNKSVTIYLTDKQSASLFDLC